MTYLSIALSALSICLSGFGLYCLGKARGWSVLRINDLPIAKIAKGEIVHISTPTASQLKRKRPKR